MNMVSVFLIGWMGLPDTQYPTDEEGWAHCLTIPRELTIEEDSYANVL